MSLDTLMDTTEDSPASQEQPYRRIQIGDEEFVIDPSASEGGEPILDPDEELAVARLVEAADLLEVPIDEIEKQLEAVTYGMVKTKATKERLRLLRILIKQGKYGSWSLRLCKYDRCRRGPAGGPAMVKPPMRYGKVMKNVQKDFCSVACSKLYHDSRRKKRMRTGWVLDLGFDGNAARLNRAKPLTRETAEDRYKKHRSSPALPHKLACSASSEASGGFCPGRDNGEFLTAGEWHASKSDDRKYPGRCLALAVFADDLLERVAAEKGSRISRRRWTTDDGRWIDRSEEAVEEEAALGQLYEHID